MARALVTGGAGYVGSHTVLQLVDAGWEVVVVDDLSAGHREAIPPGVDLVVLDLADGARLRELFAKSRFAAVLHFAARSIVSESMLAPLRYLGDNVVNAVNLIRAASECGVDKFILSSTANIFDEAERPIVEHDPIRPGSPYGESKRIIEQMLGWMDRLSNLRYAALRYFNAAGADPLGRTGEAHDPETHLIPIVLETALGRRGVVEIFGDDYPTPDGTAIRDYVHVADLARAHMLALSALERGSFALNLGSGVGYSVREVISVAERVTGRHIAVRAAPRRPGDPPRLVASRARASELLGWEPEHDLESIIRSAWRWHSGRSSTQGSPSK